MHSTPHEANETRPHGRQNRTARSPRRGRSRTERTSSRWGGSSSSPREDQSAQTRRAAPPEAESSRNTWARCPSPWVHREGRSVMGTRRGAEREHRQLARRSTPSPRLHRDSRPCRMRVRRGAAISRSGHDEHRSRADLQGGEGAHRYFRPNQSQAGHLIGTTLPGGGQPTDRARGMGDSEAGAAATVARHGGLVGRRGGQARASRAR